MKKRKVNIDDKGSLTYNGSPVFTVLGREKSTFHISSAQSSPLQSTVFDEHRVDANHSEDANKEKEYIELGLQPEDVELSMAATKEDNIFPIGQIKESSTKKDVIIANLKADLAQKDVIIAQEKLLSCQRAATITELKAELAQLIRERCKWSQKDEMITELKSESAQKDNLIIEKDKLITEKNDMIAHLKAESVQKDSIIVQKDKLIAEKDGMIAKHKVESAEMKKLISEKDDAITKEQLEVDYFIDRVIELRETAEVLKQRAVEAEELVQDCLKRGEKTRAKVRHLRGKIEAMKEAEKGVLLVAEIQAVEEFKSSTEYHDTAHKYAMDLLQGSLSDLRKKAVTPRGLHP